MAEGQDSGVGIVTRYGMEGSVFETRWVREILFSLHPCRPTLVPIHPPVPWVPGVFPGSKAAAALR